VEADTGTIAPEGMAFKDLKSLHEFLDEDIYLLAGKAIQITTCDRNHQFCGRCGASTETSEYEIAKVCPECGLRSYVRLSPAVITAIIKDGKILMAKHGYHRGMYSLIAGFVEPGETLEEAVERETMEEVGLKVKNIKYFSSQPWPYPHSLMVAFTAEYDSCEIKVDGKEITDAGWFSPDNIPLIPSKLSIARELIDWFIKKFS
jgi:NAD+ diphosphatase